jgi:hypothetical protein
MTKFLNPFLFLVIVFYLNFGVKAQGISNNWILGYYGGGGNIIMNFTHDSLILDTSIWKMNFLDLSSSISNSHGIIQFYTNGGWIANANTDTMLNGSNLAPGPYSSQWSHDGFRIPQGAIIIPFPGDSSKFYLFHETVTFDSSGFVVVPLQLLQTNIDMTLDNGLGAVTVKNNIILSDSLFLGGLTACKHANGRDWWLVTNRTHSNLFYKFLITSQGIQLPDTQSIGSYLNEGGPGQSCFSPDGKKYARYMPDDDLNIYDFDRCSGILSNPIHIPINDGAYSGGIAFSANSKFIYVSSFNYVYQFDAANPTTSKDTIAIFDGFSDPNPPFLTYFYQAQLAPNGKIYISAANGVHYMHIINHPDSTGSACDLVQHGLFVIANNAFTVPNYPNYFLGADSGSVCDTLQLSIKQSSSLAPFKLSCFPNPAEEDLNLSFEPRSKVRVIEIFDIYGQLILKQNISPWSQMCRIDVSKLKSGVYLCKLSEGSNSKSVKFIKANISE